MAYQKNSYIEHTAFRVKDIHWYIRFFKEALGMTIITVDGLEEAPNQVWLLGGLQLISDPGLERSQERMDHIAIMTDDLQSALQEVYAWDVIELPKGRNWVELPDGLVLELIQAKANSVAKLMEVDVSYVQV
ncbi:VOC family protein [Bacillus sp. FJAT-29790]|uniref:VOC family protein n=1 Tax=Bacillus sp. FJAT-29790 TaxID=1895002 RepID=UPI001C227436|nr:VOC family protein [Bacillus sp. FJAT-29790]MBU8881356.1 VOC family protein [Bacillus sp. FJAT-29790]